MSWTTTKDSEEGRRAMERLNMTRGDVSAVAALWVLRELGVGEETAQEIASEIPHAISKKPCAEVDYVGKAIRMAFAAVRENTRRMATAVDGLYESTD